MENKRVLIEYDEQSKAVVAKVSVEYSGEHVPSNDVILSEVNSLFSEAQKFALNKSLLRNR